MNRRRFLLSALAAPVAAAMPAPASAPAVIEPYPGVMYFTETGLWEMRFVGDAAQYGSLTHALTVTRDSLACQSWPGFLRSPVDVAAHEAWRSDLDRQVADFDGLIRRISQRL